MGVALVAASVIATGCHKSRNLLLETPSPPDSLLKCVQLQLAKAEYVTVGADRASGWLHAQRSEAHIYVTAIADDDGPGSHLQLTNNATKRAREDADRIRNACAKNAR